MLKTINGLSFEISAPFSEGHVITEAEAKALNQTRAENIGNNLRARIKEMQEAGESEEAIATIVAEKDAEYIFTLAAVSASRKLDPYEREALKMAKELVKAKLAADGRKVSDVPEGLTEEEWKDKLEGEYERIAGLDKVVAAARKTVDAKRKTADSLMDALSDSDV